jgi:hypothetical protein
MLSALLLVQAGGRALACASCGAGGDSPLVLYPNERVKAYAGWTRAGGLADVLPDGTSAPDGGATSRDTVTVAAGASFLTDYFATVTGSYVINEREGRSVSGPGDPQVEARWTALPPTLLDPRRPQVQVLAGYRRAAGVSAFGSRDPDQLDVTSLGYDEARGGVDVFWGGAAVKGGVAASERFPRPYNADGVATQPGRAARSIATIAYQGSEGVKVSAGAVLDARERRRDAGQTVPDSEEIEHDLFLTADWQAEPRLDVRLAVARTAAFGENKNAGRATSVTMALMGAL